MQKRLGLLAATIGTLAVLGAGCGGTPLFGRDNKPADPTVSVANQEVGTDNVITITKASMPENGWIAVHEKTNGIIGEIIGYTAFNTGTDTKIKITVDRKKISPSLVAMMHYDRGVAGTFESPGADGPVIKDQQVIMEEFTILNQSIIEQENTSTTTPIPTSNTRK